MAATPVLRPCVRAEICWGSRLPVRPVGEWNWGEAQGPKADRLRLESMVRRRRAFTFPWRGQSREKEKQGEKRQRGRCTSLTFPLRSSLHAESPTKQLPTAIYWRHVFCTSKETQYYLAIPFPGKLLYVTTMTIIVSHREKERIVIVWASELHHTRSSFHFYLWALR